MERTSFGLLFYIRRNKLNKSGEVPIFLRITVNGQRADASVKRTIPLLELGQMKSAGKRNRMQRPECLSRCHIF